VTLFRSATSHSISEAARQALDVSNIAGSSFGSMMVKMLLLLLNAPRPIRLSPIYMISHEFEVHETHDGLAHL